MKLALTIYAVASTMFTTLLFIFGGTHYLTKETWKWGVLFLVLGFGQQVAMIICASQL